MSHQKAFVNYFDSIGNEIAVDISLYNALGLHPRDYGYLPRPTRWGSKKFRHWAIFPTLARSISIFWILGGSVAFFLKDFYKFLLKRLSTKKRKVLTLSENKILAFSSRAAEIIPGIISNTDFQVITFPWEKIDERKNSVCITDIISVSQLIIAFFLAVRAVYTMIFGRRRFWILQTFTAFQWFCARLVIDKLNGLFYISEHYDRWAVLIDSSLSARLESDNTLNPGGNKLVLVQHGSLESLSNREKTFDLDLPYRLSSVSDLWIYDEYSYSVFANHILSTSINKSVSFHFFEPMITLSETENYYSFSVLFVGHPACERFHVSLYEMLKNGRIKFYYKPHPKHPAGDLACAQDWNMIYEKRFFPKVDLVISYPSTLVKEYSVLGIPALTHSIDEPEANAEIFAVLFSKYSVN